VDNPEAFSRSDFPRVFSGIRRLDIIVFKSPTRLFIWFYSARVFKPHSSKAYCNITLTSPPRDTGWPLCCFPTQICTCSSCFPQRFACSIQRLFNYLITAVILQTKANIFLKLQAVLINSWITQAHLNASASSSFTEFVFFFFNLFTTAHAAPRS